MKIEYIPKFSNNIGKRTIKIKMLLRKHSQLLFITLQFIFSFSATYGQQKLKVSGHTDWVQVGQACIYSKSLDGTKTASGETIKLNSLAAAHLKLPFGTKVRVTNMKNGKSVIVKINDRGPFSKQFIIDLTPAAADKIGFSPAQGIVNVKLEVVED